MSKTCDVCHTKVTKEGVHNCCYDCQFKNWCEKCCLTVHFTKEDKLTSFQSCHCSFLTELIVSNGRSKYGNVDKKELEYWKSYLLLALKFDNNPKNMFQGKQIYFHTLIEKYHHYYAKMSDFDLYDTLTRSCVLSKT